MAMLKVFQYQRDSFLNKPYLCYEERLKNLRVLRSVLRFNQERLLDSITKDFGQKSREELMLLEFFPSLQSIDYAISHLKKWMLLEKKQRSFWFLGARNFVLFQPLGVVGIVVPWNFPVYLSFSPLVAALSAGNAVMLKLSEFSKNTSALLKLILEEAFPRELLAVFDGGVEEAQEFCSLAFDHLLFTGSTKVGKEVMSLASKSLTPVTLELGGACPAVLSLKAKFSQAVDRIILAKLANAGQICVSPNYLLLEGDREELFIEKAREAAKRFLPDPKINAYTSIISEKHFDRLLSFLAKAEGEGARVIFLSEQKPDREKRTFPLTLLCNCKASMDIFSEEIFGPILPILCLKDLTACIHFIQERERALALYLFSQSKLEQKRFFYETHSGGLCINDSLLQVAQEDLPFGGIGASGMGQYHGHYGFETFSKQKGIFIQGNFSLRKLLYPPYNSFSSFLLKWMLR